MKVWILLYRSSRWRCWALFAPGIQAVSAYRTRLEAAADLYRLRELYGRGNARLVRVEVPTEAR